MASLGDVAKLTMELMGVLQFTQVNRFGPIHQINISSKASRTSTIPSMLEAQGNEYRVLESTRPPRYDESMGYKLKTIADSLSIARCAYSTQTYHDQGILRT